jgi:phage terminase large subunit-like protein
LPSAAPALSELDELHLLLDAEAEYLRYNKIETMYPETGPLRRELYPKNMELFAAGAKYKLRCAMGGNAVGKTEGIGGYETAVHLTGLYPDWWEGLRFDHPINCWVAGKTRETVRDITQRKLLGDFARAGMEQLGTGLIPKRCIGKPRIVQNTNGSVDSVPIRHVSGGWSVLGFKSYDQGRKAFEGTEQHWQWPDEEPPMPIFSEMLMRTRGVDGRILATFTPLDGYTEVVEQFMDCEGDNAKGASKFMVRIGWDDAPHLSEEWKREKLLEIPLHLRDSRRLGIPSAGAGRIYPVEEEAYVIKPFPIPAHFRRVGAMDVGWHNTAALWLAYDADTGDVFAYADYKRGEQPPSIHAAAMKARGDWIPWVGDAAALSQADGVKMVDLYRAEGLRLQLADKAVDAGIQAVLDLLVRGKLKVFANCTKLREELLKYRYKDNGRPFKKDDHLCDCLRYGVVSGLKVATTQKIRDAITYHETRFG